MSQFGREPHPASAERLLGWRRQTLEALSASDLNAPLFPMSCSLAEQAQGLKEWLLAYGWWMIIDGTFNGALSPT